MLTKVAHFVGGYQNYEFLNIFSTAYLEQSESKRVLYA